MTREENDLDPMVAIRMDIQHEENTRVDLSPDYATFKGMLERLRAMREMKEEEKTRLADRLRSMMRDFEKLRAEIESIHHKEASVRASLRYLEDAGIVS